MPGPKKRTPQQILEYQIRTQVWLEFLMEETGAKSINQLGVTIDGTSERGGTKWADYANLKKNSFPNETTLKITDLVVPNSYRTYQSGPDGARLFDCMWSDIGEIHKIIESDSLCDSPEFFWLNQLLPTGYLRQCDDDGMQALIGGIAKLLWSNQISLKRCSELSEFPDQHSFLSGIISVLRFAIERDYYHQYSFVIELVDLLTRFLDSAYKPKILTERNIDQLLLSWVYAELDRWASFSQTGIFYRSNGRYPSKEAFLKSPTVFVICYRDIRCDSLIGFAEHEISEEFDLINESHKVHFEQIF